LIPVLVLVVVVVPDAARESRFMRSPPAVPAVVRAPGAVAVEDTEVSRTTVRSRSRPRKSAKSTRRTRTATARIPSTPPGKLVVLVVVVASVEVVRVSVPVVTDPVVVGAWAEAFGVVAGVLVGAVAGVVWALASGVVAPPVVPVWVLVF
jgi:hypothetical protein